jgi:hypothetical protein
MATTGPGLLIDERNDEWVGPDRRSAMLRLAQRFADGR